MQCRRRTRRPYPHVPLRIHHHLAHTTIPKIQNTPRTYLINDDTRRCGIWAHMKRRRWIHRPYPNVPHSRIIIDVRTAARLPLTRDIDGLI